MPIVNSLPYNILDGTAVDAVPVMANYNQIVNDVNNNAAALASPALTGTPTAPTAAQGVSTTQIATTSFVTVGLAAVEAGAVTEASIAAALGYTPDNPTRLTAYEAAVASSTGAGLIGWIQAGTSAVFRWVQDKLRDLPLSAYDFGAAGNGSTDDKAALSAADAASAGKSLTLTPGTYLVNSNLTFANPVLFTPGAILKPASGVVITFAQNFVASDNAQIFDLSNSGALISLPYNMTEAWAEWWGAKGDRVKTNNDVPINQALTAVAATAPGGTGVAGGTVRIGRGWFWASGVINLFNNTSLRGSSARYCVLAAHAATWSGTQMVNASNGTTPMFDSRLENIRFDAGQVAAITQVVYSNAWQEKCGLVNVLLLNFMTYGFFYEIGYGGAATLELDQVEIFSDATSTSSTCVYITNTAIVGYLNLNISNSVFANGNNAPTNATGVHADNLINVNLKGVHFEDLTSGFLLSQGACVSGSGMTGGPSMAVVVNAASGWSGAVDIVGAQIAGATVMVEDSDRAYAIAALQPVGGHLIWPPRPTIAIAAAEVVGGSSPTFGWNQGFASVSHSSTGVFILTFTTTMDSVYYYDVEATCLDASVAFVQVARLDATKFEVITRNSSFAFLDCTDFSVRAYHKS